MKYLALIFQIDLGQLRGSIKMEILLIVLGALGFGFLEVGTVTPFLNLVILNQEFFRFSKSKQ
jgi:hypothetical protein